MFFKTHVFCCTNRREPGSKRGSCAEKGSEGLQEYIKTKIKELGLAGPTRVRVNKAGCLDRCELGPCMVIYPEGTWYACKTEADVDEVIATHIQQGGRVERLMLPGSE